MANVIVKGVRGTDGRKVQVSSTDVAVRDDLSSIVNGEKGVANGLATLNGSSLVVQNPANAAIAPAVNGIPIRDANSDVIVPTTPTTSTAATSKAYVDARPGKGSAAYAGAAPVYAEADALLPAAGNYGYFLKGATDTVFHLFRRSVVASTLADFGIVEMT